MTPRTRLPAGGPDRTDRDPADVGQARERWLDLLQGALGRPFVAGNAIDVYHNGEEIFPALLDAIQAARTTVEFETYLYGSDPVADRFTSVLGAAARRGVRTRVLLDGIGSWLATRRQSAALRRSGAEVRWFRSPGRWKVWARGRLANRTHRKILVVDGRVAFTGGAGISHEWSGDARGPAEWRDTHFRISGPAVAGFRAAFLEHWTRRRRGKTDARGLPLPPEGGDVDVMVVPSVVRGGGSAASALFRILPREARHRLRLTTPYFVPDDEVVDALAAAAERGVQVEILVPGPHTDHRICQIAGAPDLRRLHAAGVVIRRYQPTFIHTKTLTVDGILSVFGTANLNRRSTSKDDEILAVALDPALARSLDDDFARDASRSLTISDADLVDVPLARRALEKAVRLFREHL